LGGVDPEQSLIDSHPRSEHYIVNKVTDCPHKYADIDQPNSVIHFLLGHYLPVLGDCNQEHEKANYNDEETHPSIIVAIYIEGAELFLLLCGILHELFTLFLYIIFVYYMCNLLLEILLYN
jgi:hypothetical protein